MAHLNRIYPVLLAALTLFVMQPAFAQEETDGAAGASGEATAAAEPNLFGECQEELSDQDKMMNYSLYYESFKNQDYEASLPYLRKMLRCAPLYAGPGRVSDRNLRRAIEAYEGLAAKTDDAEQKAAYLDTAVAVFDITPAIMEAAGEPMDAPARSSWLVRKGRFMQKHLESGLAGRGGEVYEAYEQAYELAPDSLDAYTTRLLITYYVGQQDLGRAAPIFEEARARFPNDLEIQGLSNYVYPDDESRLEFTLASLEREPDNVELLQECVRLANATDNGEVLNDCGARLLEKAESGEVEPDADLYISFGQIYLEEGDPARAIEMYEKALELPDAQEKLRDIHFNMGLAYQQQGNRAKARTQFRQALEQDSQFGPALMAIGDLYVGQVSDCGQNLDLADRAVYWLAVDYYQRARSADESVARTAQQKINTYRQYFPTAEQMFFQNVEAGQSYNVSGGCYAWIGESTTAKAP